MDEFFKFWFDFSRGGGGRKRNFPNSGGYGHHQHGYQGHNMMSSHQMSGSMMQNMYMPTMSSGQQPYPDYNPSSYKGNRSSCKYLFFVLVRTREKKLIIWVGEFFKRKKNENGLK